MRAGTLARRSRWVIAALGTLAAAGCDRGTLTGPPELRLGRDECGECGMLVNEDRCSCAVIIERDGHREYIVFDDAGCLLDFARSKLDGAKLSEAYVRDFESRQWIEGSMATFLLCDSLRMNTPMGSGILAFSSAVAAEAIRSRDGGDIHSLTSLETARVAWLKAKYGKATP